MSIAEFVAKFIEMEEMGARKTVYAFLGYATIAVGGLVYVYKEYIGDKAVCMNVPDTTWLLVGSFAFAAFSSFLLSYKFVGRKNFCIEWLFAAKEAYPNIVTDRELIEKFCQDYRWFDMGRGLPKPIKAYLKQKQIYSKRQIFFLEFLQKEWLLILLFFIFFSVDFYVTAIRQLCLRTDAQTTLQDLCHWLCHWLCYWSCYLLY